MSQYRRRRLEDDSDEGGGFPIFPLVLIVVLAGLLLGAVLAHFFRGRGAAPPPSLPAVTVTPVGSPSALPSLAPTPTPTRASKPSPSPSLSPSPKASSSAAPTATPSAKPTRAPRATEKPSPKLVVAATPRPKPTTRYSVVTPVPLPVKPVPKPPPAVVPAMPTSAAHTDAGRAEAVVRSYLSALSRGDTGTARTFLANGSMPTESSFMDASAHINSLRESKNSDGTYAVAADVTTSKGEYYITFTVQVGPDSGTITEHTAIKP